jgi:DNA-binding Lrp family transcriptional regulator
VNRSQPIPRECSELLGLSQPRLGGDGPALEVEGRAKCFIQTLPNFKLRSENTMVGKKLVQAYILVTAAIGKVRQVAKEFERLHNVKSVHVVTGPYDIIVFAEAKDLASLTSVVVEGVHKTKGVVDTNTVIVVEV